jgi:arylsulfatase A-like enzyme
VKEGIQQKAAEVDRACMALITDLKARGMFEDTLIVWAGEFGRTPMSQGGSGRDHHILGFSVWLAGGGIKGGVQWERQTSSATSREGRVHVHDLHATMLHLLGVDHTKQIYRFQGRDYRLTDVFGRPSKASSLSQRSALSPVSSWLESQGGSSRQAEPQACE